MIYQLNKQESKELNKIQTSYYMNPTLSRINDFVNSYDNLKDG